MTEEEFRNKEIKDMSSENIRQSITGETITYTSVTSELVWLEAFKLWGQPTKAEDNIAYANKIADAFEQRYGKRPVMNK